MKDPSWKIRSVVITSPDYPGLLKQITDPPPVLYLRGTYKLPADCNRMIAVVGTRQMTPYGRQITRQLVAGLTVAGFVIVSGLALGIDTVAHETALAAGGCTVAVLGAGIDIVYPKANQYLYDRLISCGRGLILSEVPPGIFVPKERFRVRNRIISGLSRGVVVVEGSIASGAMITARYALDQGREVLAVPGPVTSSFSQGPLSLIKAGAVAVTAVSDIINELV
jgi:DNA processing protein